MEQELALDHIVYRLKNKPSLAELESDLRKINENPKLDSVSRLNLITTILNHTIPETYHSLTRSTRNLLIPIFQSLTGLGNLVSRISLLKASVTPHSNEFGLLSTLTEFLVSLFQPGLIPKLVKNASLVEIKEIDKLFHKGKCFGLINEISMRFHINVESTIFASSITYVGYLNMEMLRLYQNKTDVTIINTFIHSMASLNEGSLDQLFEMMFSADRWADFTESFQRMKRFERKSLLTKFLCSYVTRKHFRGRAPSLHKVAALSVLLRPVFKADLIDEILLEKVVASVNYFLNSLISLMVSDLQEEAYHSLVMKSLAYWSNVHLMKSESIIKQEARTHLVISMFSHCPIDFLKTIVSNPVFLSAVSNRLSSQSTKVRFLGIILADKLCEFSKMDKIFNLDMVSDYENLRDPQSYFKKSDIALSDVDYAWELLEEPEVVHPDDEQKDSPESKEYSSAMNDITTHFSSALRSNEVDSDDDSAIESDTEDDPTIGHQPIVAKPLYIKDLLAYISVDVKAPQAFEKRKVALSVGPSLIRQKSGFGNELSYHAEELLTNFLGATNTFDEDSFETQRLACLIAIVASYPPAAVMICQMLSVGDYSLQQRMCILSTISLAARQLKGFEDEVVMKSYQKSHFPSRMLPAAAHQKYMALESGSSSSNENIPDFGLDTIQHSIQDDLMHEASEEAGDKLAGGKILRISRSLQKRRQQSSQIVNVPAHSEFPRLIGSKFFFPLISVWYEAGGTIEIGDFSAILIGHFIKTLALLLHAAYPTAVDLNVMINEFISLIIPVIKTVSIDQLQVIESITTGILLICDITDSEFLISNYSNELKIVSDWLSVNWESIIDEKVKSLCAGLLLRLNELSESYERLFLDRMNNLY